MDKRYCYQIEEADELLGLEMSVAAAEQAARIYAKDRCDGPAKFIVWDARPATAGDAELWAACNDDDDVDTSKPGWFHDKWVPENIVHTFIYDPALNPEPEA